MPFITDTGKEYRFKKTPAGVEVDYDWHHCGYSSRYMQLAIKSFTACTSIMITDLQLKGISQFGETIVPVKIYCSGGLIQYDKS